MKIPKLTILTGRNGLRDYFDIGFSISNHINFNFSIFGYGIFFEWVIRDTMKDFAPTDEDMS